ncbi:sensor histidine kinase [Acetatifactor aquisgranensis]|uniref:sensor histidine kinase n=1 Tax=Acetatifactor aquisgranensis TaxID=2941233 RepID=UPI0020414423|nr:sensor histidine kinase [Acetatifactor aquisgranensis]
MNFLDFLKDKLLLLTLQAACMLASAAFLYATGYPAASIGILLFCWFLILSVWLLGEYVRRRRYFRQLERILEDADQKYLLGELMPESFRLEDRLYRDMIRRSSKSVIERIHAVEDAGKDYREYIESWVHEIKAPIADIGLLCEKQKDGIGRRILMENRRTENYVDMALFYARSDEVYQDYLIKETTLQDTAEEMLRKNKYYLIENRIQAEVCCPDTVYTDVKWIAFILNQLILNAVKYRRDSGPRIRISTERESRSVLLTVEDNGLGIPPEELPRIFDKGFTGTNGRIRGQSTGMGLYLCRKLCGKLGIRIGAESAEGRGTRIMLEFPVSDYLMKH